MKSPYDQYRKVQAETGSGADLVLMLYQGAVRFMNRGIAAIERRKIEDAHGALLRAQDIMRELQASLNHEAGGDLANGLFSLYQYCVDRLIEANLRKDAEPVREVRALVQELLSAWEQAMRAARTTRRSELSG